VSAEPDTGFLPFAGSAGARGAVTQALADAFTIFTKFAGYSVPRGLSAAQNGLFLSANTGVIGLRTYR
jgi:hypothetical protein